MARVTRGTTKGLADVSTTITKASITETVETNSTDSILGQILIQLRKQNAYLALVTGEELEETDIPVE